MANHRITEPRVLVGTWQDHPFPAQKENVILPKHSHKSAPHLNILFFISSYFPGANALIVLRKRTLWTPWVEAEVVFSEKKRHTWSGTGKIIGIKKLPKKMVISAMPILKVGKKKKTVSIVCMDLLYGSTIYRHHTIQYGSTARWNSPERAQYQLSFPIDWWGNSSHPSPLQNLQKRVESRTGTGQLWGKDQESNVAEYSSLFLNYFWMHSFHAYLSAVLWYG